MSAESKRWRITAVMLTRAAARQGAERVARPLLVEGFEVPDGAPTVMTLPDLSDSRYLLKGAIVDNDARPYLGRTRLYLMKGEQVVAAGKLLYTQREAEAKLKSLNMKAPVGHVYVAREDFGNEDG